MFCRFFVRAKINLDLFFSVSISMGGFDHISMFENKKTGLAFFSDVMFSDSEVFKFMFFFESDVSISLGRKGFPMFFARRP